MQPRQQFRHGLIELRRDTRVEVHLHEQRDHFGRFVYVEAGFLGALHDHFGDHAVALGNHARRGIAAVSVVDERSRAAAMFAAHHMSQSKSSM